MKPPPFRYVRAESVDHALDELAEAGYDGKVLAGGQSLVPMLNLRLARPSVLIDIERTRLDSLSVDAAALLVGATVRQHRLIEDDLIARHVPVVAEAARHIGHPAIRHRGTIGGSLCHADPTAELPLIALLLDAALEILSTAGTRTVPAAEFFIGTFTTVVQPDELLTAVRIPLPEEERRYGFAEVAERFGDFAIAAAGVAFSGGEGAVAKPRVVVTGGGERPVFSPAAEAVLDGATLTDEVIREAAAAATTDIDPPDDIHASGAYRRHLVGIVVERALRQAVGRGEEWRSN